MPVPYNNNKIDCLKENGSNLKMPFAKRIDKKLWELRTSGGRSG